MDRKYKVAILGATGMLGNGVYKVLKDKCDLVLTARSQEKFDQLEKVHGGTDKHQKIIFDVYNPYVPVELRLNHLVGTIGEVDMVINCVGVLNKFAPGMTPTTRAYFEINTVLPIWLSRWYGSKLIHPSTDCVFDGKDGQYSESSPYSPSYGTYGYAKMFADEVVKEHSLVLRCCLIGEELDPNAFQMFSWIKRQAQAGGYIDHIISPITNIEFANVCWRILTEKIEIPPMILHLATPPKSKYDILHDYIAVKKLDVQLSSDGSYHAYKDLVTDYPDILAKLRIVPYHAMMAAL